MINSNYLEDVMNLFSNYDYIDYFYRNNECSAPCVFRVPTSGRSAGCKFYHNSSIGRNTL